MLRALGFGLHLKAVLMCGMLAIVAMVAAPVQGDAAASEQDVTYLFQEFDAQAECG